MKVFLSLLLSLGVLGKFVYLFGRLQLLRWPFYIFLFLFSIVQILKPIIKLIPRGWGVTPLEKFLLLILSLQLMLNSLGIFVPETAFDALWYHLPEATVYASTGTIAKIPEIIYSTMPRLGEMYFALAVLIHSGPLIKLVSFFIYGLFLITSFFLARLYLSPPLSLLSLIILNSFPLLAWQSTSAYVDILSALFQLAALLSLIAAFKNSPGVNRLSAVNTPGVFFLSAIFTGLALSVKMQSFIHLFAILLILLLYQKKFFVVCGYLFVALLTASPWYLDNYFSSGHPLFPLNLPDKQLDQLVHAGATSLPHWLIQQVQSLPFLLIDLGINARHQLSPIIALFFPIFIFQLTSHRQTYPLVSYLFITLILWHFLPPPESRYLLGTLPVLVILLVSSLKSLSHQYSQIKIIALTSIFISLVITFGIRLAASSKYLPLLTGQISRVEYISSQTTNFNRSVIDKYYSGFWQNYHYNSVK